MWADCVFLDLSQRWTSAQGLFVSFWMFCDDLLSIMSMCFSDLITTLLMWWSMANQWTWAYGTQQDKRTTIVSVRSRTRRRCLHSLIITLTVSTHQHIKRLRINCLHAFSKLCLFFSKLYTQIQELHTKCKTPHISYKMKHCIQNIINTSQNQTHLT